MDASTSTSTSTSIVMSRATNRIGFYRKAKVACKYTFFMFFAFFSGIRGEICFK